MKLFLRFCKNCNILVSSCQPHEIILHILSARTYGDIFQDGSNISSIFRKYSFQIHPDRCALPSAKDAFELLNSLKTAALQDFEAGKYNPAKSIKNYPKITLGGTVYQPESVINGSVATLFVCENEIVKIPNSPKDNDLMANEAEVIKSIWASYDDAEKFFPELKASGEIKHKGNRRTNVLSRIKGVTLQDVVNAFPNGVELCHAAWMFNRIMTCLIITHDAGWVHNGLTLSNFIIEPETHRGVLIDFTNSVRIGSPAKSITRNKDDHPLEVMAKRPLVPATDLFMAQRVMRKLLGDTPVTQRINALLNACALVNGRLNDARDVMRTFKDALLPIFGSPKFVEFKMP